MTQSTAVARSESAEGYIEVKTHLFPGRHSHPRRSNDQQGAWYQGAESTTAAATLDAARAAYIRLLSSLGSNAEVKAEVTRLLRAARSNI